MSLEEVDKVIQKLAKLAFVSDNRCRYFVETLDPDQWIVNCYVCDECPAELAESRAYSLARIVERVLNEWYSPVEKGWSWHLYSDPNYWTARSQEVYDLANIDVGGCVQWCIFKERE